MAAGAASSAPAAALLRARVARGTPRAATATTPSHHAHCRAAPHARLLRANALVPGRGAFAPTPRVVGRRPARGGRALAAADGAPKPDFATPGEFDSRFALKYLYDGGCSVCTALVTMLKSRPGHERIFFENIVSPKFSPQRNNGITKSEAMATIHVVKADSSVVKGMEALELLYGQVGLGWVFQLAKLPVLGEAAQLIYKFISKNRMSIGGGMDAVMALGKINMEQKGEGSCAEDGECRDGYSKPAEDEAPPALAAAPAAAAAAAAGAGGGAAAAATSAAAAGAAVIRGSALDRLHILGVYLAQGGSGKELLAAPVDIATGTLLGEQQSVPLRDTALETVSAAVREVIDAAEWRGVVGVGLPGLLRHVDEDGPADSSAAPYVMSAAARRHARVVMEEELQRATGKELIVLSGAEANGYGEMLYGIGSGGHAQGLVMMCTLGRGIGVALFDTGVLVRNAEFSEYVASWGDACWTDSSCPPPSTLPESPAWRRWAKRVSAHVAALDARFKPDRIVMGGSAALSLEKWQPLLEGVSAPISRAALTEHGRSGVLGSAAGGGIQLQLRDDLARVRAAVGRMGHASPQKLSTTELRRIFCSFGAHPASCSTVDDNTTGLVLNYAEMSAAIAALGVRLTPDENKEMLVELDAGATGLITFDDFLSWWQDLVLSSPVTLIHTQAEFYTLLDEESDSGRLLVVEVGFTFCTPCKKFKPFYEQCAKRYSDARFAYLSGNENSDTVKVGRDRLGVTGSPAFFLYKNGVCVDKFSGAKEEQLVQAIEANTGAAATAERAKQSVTA